MAFEKMRRALGLGGPTVDTVLSAPDTTPGLPVSGAVRLQGGAYDLPVDTIAVGLVTRVEAENGDALLEFHRAWVAAGFTLYAGEHQDIPFTITPPWETPITHAYGAHLTGMSLGLHTELNTDDTIDRDTAIPLAVHPLPAQQQVLEALHTLGFHFRHADVERGSIYGVPQQLPFYQEIEFRPPARWTPLMDALELTFLADADGLETVLECEKHRRLLHKPHDAYTRFRLDHATPEPTTALTQALESALTRAVPPPH